MLVRIIQYLNFYQIIMVIPSFFVRGKRESDDDRCVVKVNAGCSWWNLLSILFEKQRDRVSPALAAPARVFRLVLISIVEKHLCRHIACARSDSRDSIILRSSSSWVGVYWAFLKWVHLRFTGAWCWCHVTLESIHSLCFCLLWGVYNELWAWSHI